jgi:hypothetical protein
MRFIRTNCVQQYLLHFIYTHMPITCIYTSILCRSICSLGIVSLHAKISLHTSLNSKTHIVMHGNTICHSKTMRGQLKKQAEHKTVVILMLSYMQQPEQACSMQIERTEKSDNSLTHRNLQCIRPYFYIYKNSYDCRP